ncbi:MAG: AMP-binding protein [Deltaproteobacteria bacterium]|nr:AMP-binding protein [Deltaproteobacteria bacterium]MBW2048706.1 AMP-binding protein [Deltaproteobacteria bacterium]HDZ91205.1 long-chain fatty acid--CoA ligase [Deltaproteobacteria bacterium]
MRTIRDFIDRRAAEQPEKTYMIAPEPGLSLSYGQLKEGSANLGKHLTKRGLKKGDKVSFMMGNGYQTTKIFLGTMYSGFVVAPLNLMAQPSQLQYVMDHSDTRLVFFTEDQRERVEAAASKVERAVELIQVDNDSETIFSPDQDLSGLTLPYVSEEDGALLLYTSGTTGLPKGVILSHKNMVAGGEYTSLAHELTPDDRALCSLPLYHINGEVVTAVTPLVSGGSVVMPHKFSTSDFWELISEYRCTWFSVVPTIVSYLCSATDIEGRELKLDQLRFGRSASSALPPSLHRAFEEKFKVSIVETMGLTETAAPVFSNPMDPSKRKYGSPGQAVGNEAKIIDKQGNEVRRGTQGEIMIRGDNVMKEYYKAPDKTAEALEPDGWLHTGDLGYMDEDGFVFVTGRIKELIIKGGENIAPREIDEALYQHQAVQDAAAVGIPDDTYGEEIMACVTLKPGMTATEEDLRSHCLEQLGKFKTPKMLKILDELPKGPSGKIQRLKLREMLE